MAPKEATRGEIPRSAGAPHVKPEYSRNPQTPGVKAHPLKAAPTKSERPPRPRGLGARLASISVAMANLVKQRLGMRGRESYEVVLAAAIAIVVAFAVAALIAVTLGIVIGWLFGG